VGHGYGFAEFRCHWYLPVIPVTSGHLLALIAPVKPLGHLARQKTAGVFVQGDGVGEQSRQ
jgi:hypothetical protein